MHVPIIKSNFTPQNGEARSYTVINVSSLTILHYTAQDDTNFLH